MDDAAERLAARFRGQAGASIQHGSPLYVDLLSRVAADLEEHGPSLDLLRARAGERGGQALPLRLMASLHRLALAGEAPELAAHLPSTGGDGDAHAAWCAIRALMDERPDEVDALLDLPLQTNEPGRTQSLITGFLVVAEATELPLRTLEVGASAGLNLLWPRYGFRSESGVLGDPRSRLQLPCAPWPRSLPSLEAAEARGCDTHPLDPGAPGDRLILRSAVWADQPERLERLDAALAIAAEFPPDVQRADAVAWLSSVEPEPGVATVIFHSVVEQYLPPERRAEMAHVIGGLLARATDTAPVAWLSLERPAGEQAHGHAELRLALAPDPQRRLLGLAGYHGSPVTVSSSLDGYG